MLRGEVMTNTTLPKSHGTSPFSMKTKDLNRYFGKYLLAFKVRYSLCTLTERELMTPDNNHAMMEEIALPEHLLPVGSVLGPGVSAMDLSMVLAKIFRVQYTEVALLRLEGGQLRFIFPEHLRTTGSIPLSSKAVAAHTALSKKAEIFNNFARVKHASIFETIKPGAAEEFTTPAPIQKLMSVPIMAATGSVVGVIQISRKGLDPKLAQDFSREDLHDLELIAGLLATAPAITAN